MIELVRGDITNTDDLDRAGIREASSAVVFPSDRSDEADMRSILAVMAIESIAPQSARAPQTKSITTKPSQNRADHDRKVMIGARG